MAKSAPKRRATKRREAQRWVAGDTPPRVALLRRTTRALWVEMERRLDVMRRESESGGEEVDLPILRCRVRVTLMRGALRSLQAEACARAAGPSVEFAHCAWFVELQAAMDRWVNSTVWDLQDHGVRPSRSTGSDGRCFSPEFGAAVGGLVEAYRDWSYTELWRMHLDGRCALEDLQRSDEELDRVRERMRARRNMSRTRGRRLQPP